MKKVLFVLFIFVSLASTSGQDTLQFTANLTLVEPLPPFPVPNSGYGLFTLDGNTFSYQVVVMPLGPWQNAQILGPGLGGSMLFDLPLSGCQFPVGTNLGICVYHGSIVVPDPLIADLTANRWYVSATAHSSIDVNLRGQIVLVPEPSTLTFIGIAGGFMALRAFRLWLRT